MCLNLGSGVKHSGGEFRITGDSSEMEVWGIQSLICTRLNKIAFCLFSAAVRILVLVRSQMVSS